MICDKQIWMAIITVFRLAYDDVITWIRFPHCWPRGGKSAAHRWISITKSLNTLSPRQVGRHFADDIFMCIFFNENCCILITFSLKYVRKGAIDNNLALVQMMAWRRSGDKPLSEPMMISLPTHICVTQPQWVNEEPWYPLCKSEHVVEQMSGYLRRHDHHVIFYVPPNMICDI